ncbi:MAG: hypothetical protein E7377_01495 [Clostridiales bacterium]|nr:hypothetical protein [Clostridiales bacterium]
MKKIVYVIVLTFWVFIAGIVLSVSTVYRVGHVAVTASTVTEVAKSEAEELQLRLEEAYDKKSIFFAKESIAEEIVKEFPSFRLTKFEKEYPNLLFIEVVEDAEVYALEVSNGQYAILGENGSILEVRDSHVNSVTGEENVILIGMLARGEVGSVPAGDSCFDVAIALCGVLSEELGGIRSNVTSVEVFLRAPETIFCITMREGVKIYVGTPSEKTVEKAKLAVETYQALSSGEKMGGKIVVSENGNGIFASYDEKDL